ncbi:MAG: alkaline phosphatase family protein [Methylotenera sp.]|nr:alkaline phosphatase family protein [Oligoflexia bacterium]
MKLFSRTLTFSTPFWMITASILGSVLSPIHTARAELPALPSRLIIGVDGVAYRTMQELQQEGFYKTFFPVSRTVSTFPSLSSIAWADILHTRAPLGYDRFHFHACQHGDMKHPTEFSGSILGSGDHEEAHDLWDYHIPSLLTFGTNVAPGKTIRLEMSKITEGFFSTQGKVTYYGYIVSTDNLQHNGGDVRPVLRWISGEVEKIAETYHQMTGQDLEIVIVSDHGNSLTARAKKVPLRQTLRAHGYHLTQKAKNSHDVAVGADGILSVFPVYVDASVQAEVANVLSEMAGVELVTERDAQNPNRIWIRRKSGAIGVIEKRVDEKGELFLRYSSISGDPLSYLPLVERLNLAGKTMSDGFVKNEDWKQASFDHEFPVALERIVKAHDSVAGTPAPIIVSLLDGHVIEFGAFMNVVQKLKHMGQTHGSLNSNSSNGILMSNRIPTVDTTTDRVTDQVSVSDFKH